MIISDLLRGLADTAASIEKAVTDAQAQAAAPATDRATATGDHDLLVADMARLRQERDTLWGVITRHADRHGAGSGYARDLIAERDVASRSPGA